MICKSLDRPRRVQPPDVIVVVNHLDGAVPSSGAAIPTVIAVDSRAGRPGGVVVIIVVVTVLRIGVSDHLKLTRHS